MLQLTNYVVNYEGSKAFTLFNYSVSVKLLVAIVVWILFFLIRYAFHKNIIFINIMIVIY